MEPALQRSPVRARLLHLGLWHLRSQQGRGHTAPLCLDYCWATFPSRQGPLRLGGGCGSRDVPTPAGNRCPLNCTQLGQGPKLPDLLQADVGFGMILTQSLTHGTSWH